MLIVLFLYFWIFTVSRIAGCVREPDVRVTLACCIYFVGCYAWCLILRGVVGRQLEMWIRDSSLEWGSTVWGSTAWGLQIGVYSLGADPYAHLTALDRLRVYIPDLQRHGSTARGPHFWVSLQYPPPITHVLTQSLWKSNPCKILIMVRYCSRQFERH